MTVFNTYAVGTAGVINGSTTVNGAGTLWSGINARPGDDLELDGHTVVILDVLSTTELQISPWPYASVPVSSSPASPYKIIQRSPLRFAGGQAMADVDALIASLENNVFPGNIDVTGNVNLGDDRATSALVVGTHGHIIGRNSSDGSLHIGGGEANIEFDVNNPVRIKDDTVSTDHLTGSLVLDGGLGVGDKIFAHFNTDPDSGIAAINVSGSYGGGYSILDGTHYVTLTTGADGAEFSIKFGVLDSLVSKFTFFDDGSLRTSGQLLVGNRLGYGAGAEGSATQNTSKSTAVTVDAPCGTITTHNASLAGGATVNFTVNNSYCNVSDTIVASVVGTTNYRVTTANVFNGGFSIQLTNLTGGSLAVAIDINFALVVTIGS